MLTLDKSRVIVMIFQTPHCLLITLYRLCQPLDNVSGRPILERIPQLHVNQLINLPQMRLVTNGSLELFPEQLLVQDVPVEHQGFQYVIDWLHHSEVL